MNAGAVIGNASWLASSLPEYYRFKRDIKKLEHVQRGRLARYLSRNAESAFGLEHGFANIGSWEEYSKRVPIRSYDEYEPWVSRITANNPGILTTDPVRMFEPSSGSSGPAKLIPFTRSLQKEIRRAVAVWATQNFLSQPALLSGRAYWSLTPQMAATQAAKSSIPLGFDEDSAYLGGVARYLINRTLVTHTALKQVRDMEIFWRLTSLMLLKCRDLRLISIWHPSYLALLVQRLRDNWTSLLRDLESGITLAEPRLMIRGHPARAHELAAIGCDDLRRVWRHLRLISCWTDGHAASYLPQLKALFPQVAIQGKGLVATEAIITVPIAELKPLAIRSHVFEFLDENSRVFAPWELERGQVYSVVVTTGGGLYRYRLGDRVEVEDFYHDAPSLRFLGKEDQVSDYYGEKLSENFVATVLRNLFSQNDLAPQFALLAIEENLGTPAYVLYVDIEGELSDAFAQQLDQELCANPHYDLCTRLGQLGKAQIARVNNDAFELYSRRLSELGTRIGDIKPTSLSKHSGWHHYFGIAN